MSLTALLKVTFVGKKKVSQSGEYGWFENTFKLERASNDDLHLAHISYQNLLPSGAKDYISIQEASSITKLSVKTIKELCAKGKIKYLTDGGKWLIDRISLEKYL